jgi:hypothetical protein
VNRCLLLLALPALLAAAPTPLVVGSVRDQYGAPIVGARVSAGDASTQTDAEGTFALSASGVQRVTVTCAYCRPLSLAVTVDEPVVAIVQRFDALAQEAPSERDMQSVPYSHAESIAALRPFSVLENTSHLLPGPQISDRGASSRGTLVLDNGIPIYDVAANQSPFVAFPSYSLQRVSWLPPSQAFTYGDLAGGGTVIADTHADDPWSGLTAVGSTSALRAGQTLTNAAWSTAFSRDPSDARVRGDGFFHVPLGDDSLTFTAIAAHDRYTPASQHVNTSDEGVRVDYTSMRENRVTASIVAAGGGYGGGAPSLDFSAKWTDVQAQAGVSTSSRIQFFADTAVRGSSGYYETSGAIPFTSGTIAQTRIDAGAQTAGENYSVRVGAGAFDLHVSGGSSGAKTAMDGGLVAPSFSGAYALDPHWKLDVQAGASFALPTLLEAFVYPTEGPGLLLDRNQFLEETLTYGDLRRFHASFTSLSQRVSGLDNGTIHSTGISAAWQAAPDVSVRAWLLRDNDFTRPYDSIYRFGAIARPSTVGSYWVTYESAGLRIDALYRRDLLDYNADPHFDASISTPVMAGWRVFAATERRAGIRTVTLGLRAQTP